MPKYFRARSTQLILAFGVVISTAAHARAQQPAAPEPPKPWIGTVGAGISLTSGNSDTKTFNVSFDVTHTEDKNVMKWTGLYLRGSQSGSVTVNRTSLAYRDQYALSSRAFVYGQIDYLRDTFKEIDYIVAPTGGVGYKVVDTQTTQLAFDGGAGFVVEKDTNLDAKSSGALTAGETLVHQLTPTATVKQATTNLWKTSDFGDRLHTFSVGLGLKVSERTQVSLDLLDTFKNLPPTPATKKNDVALVAALIVKY